MLKDFRVDLYDSFNLYKLVEFKLTVNPLLIFVIRLLRIH